MSTIRNLYFTLDGRVDRTTHWVFAVVVPTIVNFVWSFAFLATAEIVIGWEPDFWIAALVDSIVRLIISLVGSFALSVKRLHDSNRSAWLLLIYVVPVVGQVLLFILLGFVPGTDGDNKYGSSPRESGYKVKIPRQLLGFLLGIPCAAAITLNAVIAMGGDGFPYFPWVSSAIALMSLVAVTWAIWQRSNIEMMALLALRILIVAAFFIPVASISMVNMTSDIPDPIFPPWLWAIVFSILGVISGIILIFATRAAALKEGSVSSWVKPAIYTYHAGHQNPRDPEQPG